MRCHSGGDLDAAAHGDEVDVVAGPLEKDVADISAHDVALAAQLVGHLAHQVKHVLGQMAGYVILVVLHIVSF